MRTTASFCQSLVVLLAGCAGLMSETQLRDPMALLLDPNSPVNQ